MPTGIANIGISADELKVGTLFVKIKIKKLFLYTVKVKIALLLFWIIKKLNLFSEIEIKEQGV
jgi:hypothetical protein